MPLLGTYSSASIRGWSAGGGGRSDNWSLLAQFDIPLTTVYYVNGRFMTGGEGFAQSAPGGYFGYFPKMFWGDGVVWYSRQFGILDYEGPNVPFIRALELNGDSYAILLQDPHGSGSTIYGFEQFYMTISNNQPVINHLFVYPYDGREGGGGRAAYAVESIGGNIYWVTGSLLARNNTPIGNYYIQSSSQFTYQPMFSTNKWWFANQGNRYGFIDQSNRNYYTPYGYNVFRGGEIVGSSFTSPTTFFDFPDVLRVHVIEAGGAGMILTGVSALNIRTAVSGNGQVFLTCDVGPLISKYTTDGINWTNMSTPPLEFTKALYINNMFYLLGVDGQLYTTTNGSSYTLQQTGETDITDFASVNNTNVVAVTSGGKVLIT